MSDTVKFPHVVVPLVGEDGNAFAILGRVTQAMRRGGCTAEEVAAFMEEARAGDYDDLLNTVMKTVTMEEPPDEEEDLDVEEEDILEGEVVEDAADVLDDDEDEDEDEDDDEDDAA